MDFLCIFCFFTFFHLILLFLLTTLFIFLLFFFFIFALRTLILFNRIRNDICSLFCNLFHFWYCIRCILAYWMSSILYSLFSYIISPRNSMSYPWTNFNNFLFNIFAHLHSLLLHIMSNLHSFVGDMIHFFNNSLLRFC